MIKNIFTLILFINIVYTTQKILVPMDSNQTNHLKIQVSFQSHLVFQQFELDYCILELSESQFQNFL